MKLALGGGCHWCTEAVFQSLRGVDHVQQGWAKSLAPHDSWSEAVLMEVDEEMIPLEVLIEIHLRTHSSMSEHSMRSKYRSAIYFPNDAFEPVFKRILDGLQADFPKKLITQVLPLHAFRKNDEPFLNYYRTNPSRPFCQTYIEPKLKSLKSKFAERLS